MIKLLERNTKQFFLDKFAKSKHLDTIKELKDDKLVLWIGSEDDYRSEQQRKATHMIISELWKSGEVSFDTYKEFRDDIKHRNGFIEIKAPEISERLRPKINAFYNSLDEIDKKEFAKLIMDKVIRSLSSASKEEYTIIMKDLLWLVDELGVSSKKLDEARDMWLESNKNVS